MQARINKARNIASHRAIKFDVYSLILYLFLFFFSIPFLDKFYFSINRNGLGLFMPPGSEATYSIHRRPDEYSKIEIFRYYII